jgi:hypothetical protein
VPETGKIKRDNTVLAGESRQLLEPVCPASDQAVDENQRRSLAQFDDVQRLTV